MLLTEVIPVDRGDRIIWLLEQVQAPLLYIVGILITASLLITLQAIDNPLNWMRLRRDPPDQAGSKVEADEADEQGLPPEELLVLDGWRTAKFVIVIILGVIVLGLLLATLEPTSTPDAIAVVVYYTILVMVYLIYLVRVNNRYKSYRAHRSQINPERILVSSTLDVAVIGFTVFLSWLVYIIVFGFFGHRDPTVAAFIMVIPVAPLVGFLSIVREIIRTSLRLPQPRQQ